MPDITINIDVYCSVCGDGLCHLAEQHGTKQAITIEPCPRCLDNEKDKGYEEGYAAAEKKYEK